MSNLALADTTTSEKRVIGSVEGDPDGPTVVILAGMHGNEPAGVKAVSEVLNTLNNKVRTNFRGKLVGLRGNLEALKHGVRFIDEDMNRIWFPSIIEQIRHTPEDELDSSERLEIKHLLQILDDLTETDAPVIIADVHTFSAEGWMFSITNRESRQTNLLSQLHIPMVFGIEETLSGTALGYYQEKGMIAFGLEGGQHENDLTSYNTQASIILLLEAAGCIKPEFVSEIKEFQQHLRLHTEKLPAKAELVYQHIIEQGDDFAMRPGYKNFQPVKKDEWLANDREGKIQAQCDGYILMPLYQSQGDDGFFIIREYKS